MLKTASREPSGIFILVTSIENCLDNLSKNVALFASDMALLLPFTLLFSKLLAAFKKQRHFPLSLKVPKTESQNANTCTFQTKRGRET